GTGAAAAPDRGRPAGPHADVVHDHGFAGGRRAGGSAPERGRELATHREVEDDEEAVLGGVGPGARVHVGGPDGVELHAVEVPAQLLRVGGPVPLHRVRVEVTLAGGPVARHVVAAAGVLVARPARAHSTVEGGPLPVDAVDVLHDVDLADAGPVPQVAPVRRAEHPERRPVPGRGRPGDVRHLDARLDVQLAAGGWLEVVAVGLDAAGRPAAVVHRPDAQVPLAAEGHVRRAGRHGLDLVGTEVGGAARVADAGGVPPVAGVDAAGPRALDTLPENSDPAPWPGWRG